MQQHYERITVSPIAGALGAEIGGVDVGAPLDDQTVAEIRNALLEHLVIFFRDQQIDVEQHKTFTRRFGRIFVHPNYNVGGDNDPELVYLLRRPGDRSVAGEQWHADTTMMQVPPMGAILYALEVPSYGDDTQFANQYLAYQTLSDGMKSTLRGLRAVHDDTRVAGPRAAMNQRRSSKVREDADWRPTTSVHPIVREHPETGRPGLFVNPVYTQHIEGMTVEESRPLLEYLYAHACRPEFTCRFDWRPGSIAFWDNRCTLHLAIHDRVDAGRHMRRTQIEG
ncbi:MAG: TauD/TfdA family dioxygenase [Gammaproteobacteria bacterium]|nr:TauD/TfdA family dioxygenase [Gammaproteobacteria bacterium]